jgi:hypothetical protein
MILTLSGAFGKNAPDLPSPSFRNRQGIGSRFNHRSGSNLAREGPRFIARGASPLVGGPTQNQDAAPQIRT